MIVRGLMQTRIEFDQRFIIDIMNALSTPERQVQEDGVCAGITMLAVQAFLAGELHAFAERINKLYRIWIAFGGETSSGFDKEKFKQSE